MELIYILLFCFAQLIKAFVCGIYFGDKYGKNLKFKEKARLWSAVFLIFIFGEIMGVLVILLTVIGFFYHQFWRQLHLGFIFKYRVFKRPILDYEPGKVNILKAELIKPRPKWWRFGERINRNNVKWIIDYYKA